MVLKGVVNMKLLTWNVNGLRATVFGGIFTDNNARPVGADRNGVSSVKQASNPRSFSSLDSILNYLDADIFCFQEVKTPRDQLEESLAVVPGFTSFFSFCQRRKNAAYSGVATFCKDFCTPFKVEEGLSGVLNSTSTTEKEENLVGHYGDLSEFTKDQLKELDSEGRSLISQHRISDGSVLSVINVYCPYGGEEGERTDFKMNFYKLLRIRAAALIASGSFVVILGDINTSHHLVDHCEGDSRDPKEFYENPGRTFLSELLLSPSKVTSKVKKRKNVKSNREAGEEAFGEERGEGEGPGFAAEVRDKGDDVPGGRSESHFSNDRGNAASKSSRKSVEVDRSSDVAKDSRPLVDAFRLCHPTRNQAFTCWNTSIGARATNYGTRIDYIFPDVALTERSLSSCDIMPNIEGSDHCPVKAEFDLEMVAASRCPPTATKYWPEYAGGKQKTLGAFFEKRTTTIVGGAAGSSEEDGDETRRKKRPIEGARSDGGDAKRTKSIQRKNKPKTILDFVTKRRKIDADHAEKANHAGHSPRVVENSPSPRVDDSSAGLTVDSQNFSRLSSSSSQKENSNSRVTPGATEQTLGTLFDAGSSDVATKRNDVSSDAWKKLLKGPGKAPLCKGHREPCVGNKVKKPGPNFGKKFYACARPTGHTSNKEARCNHFEWAK